MAFKFNMDRYSNFNSHISDNTRPQKKSEEELQQLASNIDNHMNTASVLSTEDNANSMEQSQNFYEIPLDKIKLSPHNKFRQFDDKEENSIESLKHSLSMVGLIHPLLVNDDKDGTYTIIAGERRYRAITELGWETATCQVTDISNVLDTRIAIYQANTETRTYTTEEKLVLCEELIEILEERQKETGVRSSVLQKCADILKISYRQAIKYKNILDKKKELESLGEDVTLVSPDGDGKSLNKIDKELTEKLNEIHGVTLDSDVAEDNTISVQEEPTNEDNSNISSNEIVEETTIDINTNSSFNNFDNDNPQSEYLQESYDTTSDEDTISGEDIISDEDTTSIPKENNYSDKEDLNSTEINDTVAEPTEEFENQTSSEVPTNNDLTYPIFEGIYNGETVTGIGYNSGNQFHIICFNINENGKLGIKMTTPERNSIRIIGTKKCFGDD